MREGRRFCPDDAVNQGSKPRFKATAVMADLPAQSIHLWLTSCHVPWEHEHKNMLPYFCYTVSFSFVSVLSNVRKLSLFSQQSTWKVNNTAFFPALLYSLGDCLAGSLGQRGLHRLQWLVLHYYSAPVSESIVTRFWFFLSCVLYFKYFQKGMCIF